VGEAERQSLINPTAKSSELGQGRLRQTRPLRRRILKCKNSKQYRVNQ
jgi:hypothetical protein